MALQPQNERPFGFRDKLGYLFGDFGNDFTFIFAGSYLTLFYTDVLGVSAGLVGVLFVVARCVDAFTDVGMGRLVDTLPPSRGGRFRPWILRVCVPVALASVLMYLYFARSWPYAGKVAYMFATYIFWGSICYTAINIPYGSMASVLSADAGERASLSTFRSVGAMLANLIIAAATPLFLFRTAADGTQTVIPERFTVIAVVYGVCAVACYLLCYALCRERVQAAPPREAKRQSFASLAKALAGNRALTAVIGAALLLLLASLLGQGMNMYLFKDYFNSADMLSLVGFAGVLPMLALAPFAAKLSKRFGKKEAGCVGVGVAAAAYLLMWALRLRSVWAYIGLMLVGSVGVGFFNMVIWAFITDVIGDEEVIAAAKAAHAHHFIQTLPGGYDMELNEDASNVSQGQKQLLTIARAILADNPILILDEATSSVDTRTEIRIQKALDNLMKGRTSFVIAHRLSTIKNADMILVMKDGDIIEQGTHDELLAKNGFYAELYNSQFEE